MAVQLVHWPKTNPASFGNMPASDNWVSIRSMRYSASLVSSTNRIAPVESGNQGVPISAVSTVRLPPSSRPLALPLPKVRMRPLRGTSLSSVPTGLT